MSSPIEWNNSLALGVDEMDHEHKKLIQLMEDLYKSGETGADFNTQKSAFDALLKFTKQHFDHEEKYMESIKFEGLDTHKRIHIDLLNKASAHYNAFLDSRKLTSSLFDFLNLWLLSHIKGIDAKYAAAGNKKAA